VGESLAAWVADVIQASGYPGVALLMFAENLFPPIPSEVILPLAGFLVNQGELRFVPALVVATVGSLAGALVLYALGRWGGRTLVLRYG
jgi:membrane protein DedA with SNARE-associated domain